MGLNRTEQQQHGVDNIVEGFDTKLIAYAGCAKTTTLKESCQELAVKEPSVRIKFIAFNSSIAKEADRSFPDNTKCKTMHGFAMQPVGHKYRKRLFDGRKSYGREVANILGISQPLEVGPQMFLAAGVQGRLVNEALRYFCYSADHEIGGQHIPYQPGADMEVIRTTLLPYVKKAWADVIRTDDQGDGRIGIKNFHDIYLKLWQLSEPKMQGDIAMIDEAQDTNACVASIFNSQDHMQLVMVGDSNQQIYGWRGAEDAMEKFQAQREVLLSQSFRFGPAIAAEGTKWLKLLGNTEPMQGWDQIESRIESLDEPLATLCRTNAGVMSAALDMMGRDKKVAVVGGTEDIKRFTEAARDLQAGNGTDHPELAAFKDWGQVRTFVAEEAGDLKVMVNAIDTYGVQEVLNFCDSTVSEDHADAIFSTAHKAKGREWESVKIGNDFQDPADKEGEDEAGFDRAEAMLAYVSVTRAMNVLDPENLSWVDNFLDNGEPESDLARYAEVAGESEPTEMNPVDMHLAIADKINTRKGDKEFMSKLLEFVNKEDK